jgi:hypothetical protein
MRGNGIEVVRELQWEVGMLAEHWVERVGRRRRLTTAGKSSSGAVAAVVEWKSSRGGEMQPRERIYEIEDSWWFCEKKKGRWQAEAAAVNWRRASRLRVPAARREGAGRGQQGSGERRAGDLEGQVVRLKRRGAAGSVGARR